MNYQFLVAAFLVIAGGSLHFYTMEVWIWPKLKADCFPSFPFGDSKAVMIFYRLVWHFFTVEFILSAAALLIIVFSSWIAEAAIATLALYIALHWIGNVIVSLIITYLGIEPGTPVKEVVRQIFKAWQWLVMTAIFILILWGRQAYL